MTTATTATAARTATPTAPRPAEPAWLRLLNWFAARDHAYRQRRKLAAMSDERLADMGLTREQAEHAFDAYDTRLHDRWVRKP